ncbi:substrate-binding domain-containing protein [Streptomyces sp. NPDC051940]|uniref:substrate-binding domain-containing protein n=1 Tax=Streptomyces sp. NPDC051940 TaxID=3155675 RepID=UPI003449895E
MAYSRMARTTALLATAVFAMALTACSDSGGKDSEDKPESNGAGKANTARMTIAMITHSGQGDTFWDIVKSGAQVAADKDNVKLNYSASPEANDQAQLVQSAIDQKVDGIIVTLAKPDAMKAVVEKAVAAGIPVVSINSGAQFAKEYGALVHFGQEEGVAGEAVGEQLNADGKKKAVCLIHEQGNVSLEERCAGVKKTFQGTIENLQVEGTNRPGVEAAVEAKLTASKDIDAVVALNADIAAAAVKAKGGAESSAEISTFDLNKAVMDAMEKGEVAFAVDQQPYLQGYLAVDELWLYKQNLNVIGGGRPVFTGPAIVTAEDAPALKKYTDAGTR